MYIKKETIDKITDAADLVAVISKYVELKKSGANYKGLSPWTKERTGSFMVSPSKGIWKDFSSGKGGNSAVSFVMELTGCSYPEAIKELANHYAIEVEYEDSKHAKKYLEKEQKKQALAPILEATAQRFEAEFEKLPADHPAKKEVFEKRKYNADIVDTYRIGYAPGKRFIYDLCLERGLLTEAKELGLISDKGDKWVDRVIYPLIEKKGSKQTVVGFAGRVLDDSGKYAKWLNSQDSTLYNKELFWYGLNHGREEIVKREEVWLVEGYNDVIAWQTNGIMNTVASCGTAISDKQIQILKKLCSKIVFCLDRDDAGIRSMVKYIPEFLKNGFRVQLVDLGKGMDPDDFVRTLPKTGKEPLLQEFHNPKNRMDGFKFLMDAYFHNKDEIGIVQEVGKLLQLIEQIDDQSIQVIYKDWLRKESKLTVKQLNDIEKSIVPPAEPPATSDSEYTMYVLPKEVKEPLDKLIKTIEAYDMFIASNQIWVKTGDEPPFYFRSVSNFGIEIVQHMNDEKFPMKLVKIWNIFGQQCVFDMASADMNTPLSFENAVTAHGNFRWRGSRKDHELLKTYLFDRMNTGRKIDVLGWQPENIWVWNNLVVIPGQGTKKLDKNGVFSHDGVTYYVPSANEIYRNSLYHYEAQKKFVHNEPKYAFLNFATQVIQVHRHHGMIGLLHSIASVFQDVVVKSLKSFPMLFLYGPASSGKDQLADVCQSFFGEPQTAINLEGGVSTMKAQVREFAQFGNGISQLSEYKTGDQKLDGMLKGLWDRRGYKRGTIESHVGTDSIPILSSTIMTGNYAPDQEALITRLVWCNMDKTVFTQEESVEYDKLSDMLKEGISGYVTQILNFRDKIVSKFNDRFREFRAVLTERHPEANSRIITNLSVYGTFYQLFQDVPNITFPFSHADMMVVFGRIIELTQNKLSGASIINRWWDCFLASMRGTESDQIKVGRDMKLEGDKLYFNFTSCYLRVSRQWYSQYRDVSPGKGVMMDALKKDKAFVDYENIVTYSAGRDGIKTSGYLVNLNLIGVSEEIKQAAEFQESENSRWAPAQSSESPATPKDQKNNENISELPF